MLYDYSTLTSNMCLMPRSGFQSFFRVLTQISPFFATFGWKIFVRKNALGGVCGKSFPSASLTLKIPPAYGVPAETMRKDKKEQPQYKAG